jgi:hypothetical protein
VDEATEAAEPTSPPLYVPTGVRRGAPVMLAWLNRSYGGDDDVRTELWADPALTRSLEALVREHAETHGVRARDAIKALDDAIRAEPSLRPAFRAKLLSATATLREEQALTAKLGQHGSFDGLDHHEVWQLFAPGRGVAGRDKWDREARSQGSMAGMMRAFGRMFEAHLRELPITAESLLAMQKDATQGTYATPLALDEGARVRQGFRDGKPATVTLARGKMTTEAGLAELAQASRRDGWFTLGEDADGNSRLDFAAKDAGAIRARAQAILAGYVDEIGRAGGESEKRLAIARATQGLCRLEPFEDGNTRTLLFLLMNRLLLDARLLPAILLEPKAAIGFSLEELADDIRLGQIVFHGAKGLVELEEAARSNLDNPEFAEDSELPESEKVPHGLFGVGLRI